MSTKVALKLAALMTALTFTIVAILWLNQGHMNSFWTSLGFQTGDRINWCSERVKSIYIMESGSKLLEKDGKWIWRSSDQSEKELDYLRVEKWFARFCQVPYQPRKGESSVSSVGHKPQYEVEFIDGNRQTIYQLPVFDREFLIAEKEFHSEFLHKGLKELLDFGKENQ